MSFRLLCLRDKARLKGWSAILRTKNNDERSYILCCRKGVSRRSRGHFPKNVFWKKAHRPPVSLCCYPISFIRISPSVSSCNCLLAVSTFFKFNSFVLPRHKDHHGYDKGIPEEVAQIVPIPNGHALTCNDHNQIAVGVQELHGKNTSRAHVPCCRLDNTQFFKVWEGLIKQSSSNCPKVFLDLGNFLLASLVRGLVPDYILFSARGMYSPRHLHCSHARTRHNLVNALFTAQV